MELMFLSSVSEWRITSILYYFIVPNEIYSNISTNPVKTFYEVGSNVTLTCSISYHKSPYIDVSTTIYMEWICNKRKGSIISTIFDDYSFHYDVDELKLSDAGEYICLYYINPTVFNPYIKPSENKYHITNITVLSKSKYCLTSLYFMLRTCSSNQ